MDENKFTVKEVTGVEKSKVEVEEEQEVEIKVEENPSVDSNTKDNATSAPEVVFS